MAACPDTFSDMTTEEQKALVAHLLRIQSVAAGQREALAELGRICDRLRAGAVLQERQASEVKRRLQADLLARDADLAELRRSFAASEIQLTGLQEEIARIHASKAWRVMAPARWLRTKLMARRNGGV